METSKKRKRETPLPVVSYDTGSRTFDRILKEDSLDAVKRVVRKKLDIPPSAPLFLTQLRDGKNVDLEDSEDFEAFVASAQLSLAVKVKVVVGNAQAPAANQSEIPVSVSTTEGRRRKKRRKKQNAEGNAEATSAILTSRAASSPHSSPETEIPTKKRRVSFLEPPPYIGGKDKVTESTRKSRSIIAGTAESSDNAKKSLATDSNDVQKQGDDGMAPTSRKDKEKKKKKRDDQPEPVADDTPDAQAAEKKKRKKKKRSESVEPDAPATSEVETAAVADDAPPTKKSKKRSRNEVAVEEATAESSATERTTKDTSTDNEKDVRPSKRSKKKSAEVLASEDVMLPQDKAATSNAKPDDAVSPIVQTPLTTAQQESSDAAVETKKAKRKKNKSSDPEVLAMDTEKNDLEKPKQTATSAAEEPVAKTESTKRKSKKSKDTTEMGPSAQNTLAPALLLNPVEEVDSAASKEATGPGKESEATQGKEKGETTAKKTGKKKKDLTKDAEQGGVNQDTSANQDAAAAKQARLAQVKLAMAQLVAEKTHKPPKVVHTDPVQDISVVDKSSTNKDTSPATAITTLPSPLLNPPVPTNVASPVEDPKARNQVETVNANPSHQSGTATGEPDTALPTPAEDAPKKGRRSSLGAAKAANVPLICPVCDASPFHARYRCPVIKAGIRSMRKRIAELEEMPSNDSDDDRKGIIEELRVLIEKKTKKPRVSEVTKPAVSAAEAEPLTVPQDEVAVEEASTVEVPAPAPVPASPKGKKPRASATTKVPISVTRVESLAAAEAQAEARAEAEVASPGNSPGLKFPPTTQSSSKPHPSLSQPATGASVPNQTSPYSKAANNSQTSINPFLSPTKLSEGPLRPDFLAFGDVTKYSDKDLEALIRGPRPSLIQDIPESDTDEEEDNEQEDAVLEEEDIQEAKLPRNANRVEYPSSSDAGDDDDDEEEEGKNGVSIVSLVTQPANLSQVNEQAGDKGNLSFREVNENGSSVEPDNAGDVAANAAVDADISPLVVEPTHEESKEGESDEDDASPSVAAVVAEPEQKSSESTSSSNPPHVPTSTVDAVDEDDDPIEQLDEPVAPAPSQPEAIDSDDEPPHSTPKAEVYTRTTRSQRGKANGNVKSVPPASTQPAKPSDDGEEVVKPARTTRNLRKLSEIPIPPNPSARVLRPPVTPASNVRTRRQLATTQEESQERPATPEEPEPVVRTTRAAARAAKTPAKTPAKTASKAPAKTAAKTPAKAPKVTTAKPLSKQAPQSPGKATKAPVVDENGGSEREEAVANNVADASVAEWAVLHDNGASQADTDATAMIDELLPSPAIASPKSTRNVRSRNENASSQTPLFFPAESQQSFPYSQYPDLFQSTQQKNSPNDSEDEEEVVAAVVNTSAPTKQISGFRSLREIISQPSNFVKPRLSQYAQRAEEPVDMYGKSGKQSEDEEEESATDDSDSETEKKPASHIPSGRLAGLRQTKKTNN